VPGSAADVGSGASPATTFPLPVFALELINGRWITVDPTRALLRAGANVHERKVKGVAKRGLVSAIASAGKKAFGELTELSELIDSLYNALPADLRADLRRGNGGHELGSQKRLEALFKNYQQIDMVKAASAIAADQMQDTLIGGASGGIVEATGGSPLSMTLSRYAKALQV